MTTATLADSTETAVTPVLSVRDVTIRLSGRDVLCGVNFTMRPGEFVGVLGPNGAGKTTLLRAILGLLQPSQGSISIFGHPSQRGNPEIGYVPQHQTLDTDLPMRARDFVRLGLDGDQWGVGFSRAGQKTKVNEALESVGAASYADAPVGRLSGGQQQRLLLAQAIVGNPSMLLLDEPLANLDIRSRWEVVDLVTCLSRDRNIAVLFVAHDVNPLLDAVDDVIYLAHGHAVCGPVDQVIRSDVLTELYGFPVVVIRAEGHVLVTGAGTANDCHA
ncbi:MAG: metal ABC transporter ATP-binding protein [Chloroflexota bacterium]